MNQQSTGPNENRGLVSRAADTTRNQLATLANSFKPGDVPSLLTTAIRTGEVDSIMASAALASDPILDEVLKNTHAYQNNTEHTPGLDFSLLSTGNSTEAAAALRRLTAGFYVARSGLASEVSGALDREDDPNPQIFQAFQIVNDAYALVISTAHQLFDQPDPAYREALRPEFLNLLKMDPYLKDLLPSFENLLGASTESARKIALKTFFVNFCDNAVAPYLYNDRRFSAMVQSILLRELRHVIKEEAKLPVPERKLAPYLAKLFDERMRDELETARTNDGKPQPVLESLKDCPGEGKYLMRAIHNFLIESLGDAGVGILLEDKDIIACEVMLSVGCLLPETELTQLLGTTLLQVEDLNPSLVLVFSSALKFSLLASRRGGAESPISTVTQIEPTALIDLGLKIAPDLSEPEQERLIAEVFLPLADDFIRIARDSKDKFNELPAMFRAECVNKVILQRVLKAEDSAAVATANEDTMPSEQTADLLVNHLELVAKTRGCAPLNPVGLRWLVLQGAEGKLNPAQTTQVIKSTLNDGAEAEALGVEPEIYDLLLTAGGYGAIENLASKTGYEERLSHQLCIHSPRNEQEKQGMRAAFSERLVKPLRSALTEYAEAVTLRRQSDLDGMKANEALQELGRVGIKLAELKQQLPILRTALDDSEEFLDIEGKYAENLAEIKKKESLLASVEGTTKKQRRELVESGEIAPEPDSLLRGIETLKAENQQLCARSIKLPDSIQEDLPNFTPRSLTLGKLFDMEKSLETNQEIMDRAEGESRTAVSNMQSSIAKMAERRTVIKSLFSLVQRAAESAAVKGIDPESLNLSQSDTFDPLGLFCRVSLAVQMNQGKGVEEGAPVRLALEQDVKNCLTAAFTDPLSKEDSKLVLNELATLMQRGANFMLDWEPGDSSLAGFLHDRITQDIEDDAMAWLSHDIGWDESMHAPIIKLFGSMTLRDKDISKDSRAQALKLTFTGVEHWVKQECRIRAVEEHNRNAASDEMQTVPERFVTSHDLIGPWTAALTLTQGRSRTRGPTVVAITDHIATEVLAEVESADKRQLKSIYIPLFNALRSCSKSAGSVLNPLPESPRQFVDAVRSRANELTNQSKQRAASIRAEAPAKPASNGLSFEELSGPDRLSLPSPVNYEKEQPKRLEG